MKKDEKHYKSDAFAAVHESMDALHQAGVISEKAMRKFDETCLKPAADISAQTLIDSGATQKDRLKIFAGTGHGCWGDTPEAVNKSIHNLRDSWSRAIVSPDKQKKLAVVELRDMLDKAEADGSSGLDMDDIRSQARKRAGV